MLVKRIHKFAGHTHGHQRGNQLLQMAEHPESADVDIRPEAYRRGFGCRTGDQRDQSFLLRAEESAVIDHQLLRLLFRQHIRVVVGLVLNERNAPDGGQVDFRNEIHQRAGYGQPVRRGANTNTSLIGPDRAVSGKLIKFRAGIDA